MGRITWRDRDGIVHAVVDDCTFSGEPPFALIKLCYVDRTWHNGRNDGGFGHIESGEIRAAEARDVVTCFSCLASMPGCDRA